MISKISIEGACRSIDEQARYVFMDELIKNKSVCCRCNKQEYDLRSEEPPALREEE